MSEPLDTCSFVRVVNPLVGRSICQSCVHVSVSILFLCKPVCTTATFSQVFWSYRPQDRSIWSKIWCGSWFWGPFASSSPETLRKHRKTPRNFRIEKLVLRSFDQVFEELRPNKPQNQIRRQILLQIHFSWGLYDQKPSKKVRTTVWRCKGLRSMGPRV